MNQAFLNTALDQNDVNSVQMYFLTMMSNKNTIGVLAYDKI